MVMNMEETMHRSIRYFLMVLLLPGLLLAQKWAMRYDAGGNDAMTAMAVDVAGNVYVTGYSAGAGTANDFMTIKYTPNGDTVWTRRAGGAGDDSAFAIALDGSGNIYVTGCRESLATGQDYLTVKYDPAGVMQWSRTYTGSGSGRDQARAIALDGSGNVYVSGTSDSAATGSDFLTVAYSSSGTVIWTARYAGSGTDMAVGLGLDGAGSVYVAGSSWGGTTPQMDYLLIRYRAGTGDSVWTRRHNAVPNGNEYLSALAVSGPDGIFITGASESTGTSIDWLTLRYDSAGTRLWVRRYDRNRDADSAVALVPDGDGNVYVTGYACPNSGNEDEDFATIKYGPTGSTLWTRTYDQSGSQSVDVPRDITRDAFGNIYVAGTVETNNNLDFMVLRYEPGGTLLWSARYNAATDDDDLGIAVRTTAAHTFVGGSSWSGSGYDFLTVAYAAHDAGIAAINAPRGTLKPFPITPDVTVLNSGSSPEDVTVHVWISPVAAAPVYYDVQTVYGLAPGDDYDLQFHTFIGSMGMFVMTCSLALPGDQNKANDTARSSFTLQWTQYPYWFPQFAMPSGPKLKLAKNGAALAYGQVYGNDNDTRYLWALKGNNTREFFRFHLYDGDTWHALESIPNSLLKKKGAKNGAGLVYDRYDTAAYALKGNNTREFWKYDPRVNWWYPQDDLPSGLSFKNVKGGGSMLFYRTGSNSYVYALKGNKTKELWAFHVNGDSWFPRETVPGGLKNKGMADGSCLVNAGGTFYALKGSYNEFYAYFPGTDSWAERRPMPIVGTDGKKKKAKDGTALCYSSGDHVIYALKGGTNDFWGYFTAADTWVPLTPLTTSSSGRVVKGGGALAYGNGYAWALRGNRTNELWTYDPGDAFLGDGKGLGGQGATGVSLRPGGLDGLRIEPNPVHSAATVRLPQDICSARIELYDITGQLVRVAPAAGRTEITLDRAGLASGVYLLRVIGADRSLVRKVVVE